MALEGRQRRTSKKRSGKYPFCIMMERKIPNMSEQQVSLLSRWAGGAHTQKNPLLPRILTGGNGEDLDLAKYWSKNKKGFTLTHTGGRAMGATSVIPCPSQIPPQIPAHSHPFFQCSFPQWMRARVSSLSLLRRSAPASRHTFHMHRYERPPSSLCAASGGLGDQQSGEILVDPGGAASSTFVRLTSTACDQQNWCRSRTRKDGAHFESTLKCVT